MVVENNMVESLTRMSLKEANNSWKCQHFPMDLEQKQNISLKAIMNGMLFLNSNSKQPRMYCGNPQKNNILTVLALGDMNSSLMSIKGS